MNLETFPTSATGRKMLDHISAEFYAKSYVAKWLFQIMGLEWDEVWEIIKSLPDQAFPETATWGLMYHEMKFGLPVKSSINYDERRQFIYRRRDVRKPMNPWTMEQLVLSLTNRTSEVYDSNDDPTIPTNTFVLNIDSGEGDLDLNVVVKKLNEVKQSHVTFTIRVCGRSNLTVTTSEALWRRRFPICGTIPYTSRGLRLKLLTVEADTAETAVRKFFRMTSNRQITGTQPVRSRGVAFVDRGDNSPGISASTRAFGSRSRVCGSVRGL